MQEPAGILWGDSGQIHVVLSAQELGELCALLRERRQTGFYSTHKQGCRPRERESRLLKLKTPHQMHSGKNASTILFRARNVFYDCG
jgi:hypothetical protein